MKTTTERGVDIRRMKRPPTHPGEMLQEEFLGPLGITQAEAARRMRMSTNRINEVVRGKRGVSAETALRLADLLGTSPEFWLNLQMTFDLWQAFRAERRRGARPDRSPKPALKPDGKAGGPSGRSRRP